MIITKLSIIIPLYNEASTIQDVLDRIKNTRLINGIAKEVIIVDDASTDASASIIQAYQENNNDLTIRQLTQGNNQGKGAAVSRGIAAATGEYIIIQDADLEYNPQDFNIMLQRVIECNALVVYGSRFINKPSNMEHWHYFGNRALTYLSNVCSGLKLTDMETCYKLIKSDLAKSFVIKEKRFGLEPELTAYLAKNKHANIYEVPISYNPRNYAEGKKIGWQDGFRAIYSILKYNFF